MERQIGPRLTGSWHLLRKSIDLVWQYAGQVIIIAALPALLVDLGGLLDPIHTALGRSIYGTGLLLAIISTPASFYLQVHAARGEVVTIPVAYKQGLRVFGRLIIVTAFSGIAVIAGLLLFIVPGLKLWRAYVLAPMYVIDKNLSAREALRQSAVDSKPVARYIWGTAGVVLCMAVLSFAVGMSFIGIPGISGIIASLLSLTTFFIVPLRYVNIDEHTQKKASVQANNNSEN